VKPAIRVHNLTVSYAREEVLRALNWRVTAGKRTALLGRSGSGKSTLLRSIIGVQTAVQGDVWIGQDQVMDNGRDCGSARTRRGQVVLVSHETELLRRLTVRDNLRIAHRLRARPDNLPAETRIQAVAESLGVGDLLARYPDELSTGQRDRAQLARALVVAPSVLLVDEVTAHVDRETREDMAQALVQLAAVVGAEAMTLVIVTHLVGLARSLTDEVAFLDAGQVALQCEWPSLAQAIPNQSIARFFADGHTMGE